MEQKISVIMPVYNIMGIKDQAVQAIDSIMRQTIVDDLELVIVDDGSTDGTFEWLARNLNYPHSIKLRGYKKNKGIAPALNECLRHASHELVARHDIDDYSALDRFEIQRNFMNENPDVALCGTGMYVVDTKNRMLQAIRKPTRYNELRNIIKHGCPFAHGSVIFRKSILWDKEGGYDESDDYKYAEDYELWVRMVSKYKCDNIQELLYFHRDHPNKVSIKHGKQQSQATDRIIAKARKLIP